MIISGNGAEKTRLSERRDDGKAALPVKAWNSELLRLLADFAAALPPAPPASDGEQDKGKCVSGGRGHSGLRHSPQNPHEYGFYTSGSLHCRREGKSEPCSRQSGFILSFLSRKFR